MFIIDQTNNTKINIIDNLILSNDVDPNNLVAKCHPIWYMVDWTKEPIESIQQLRAQRAQQIRDKYNYLILYYSGGSDSQTVLNTFLNNNIQLDHIVINRFEGIDDPRFTLQFAIDYVQNSTFNGVLTVNDISLSTFKQKVDQWSNRKNPGTEPSHSINRANLDYFGLTPKKKNIAHIYGIDKCQVDCIDIPDPPYQQYRAYFSMENYTRSNHPSYGVTESENVYFFTDHEFPQLHIKECHMIMQWMKDTDNNCLFTNKLYRQLLRDPHSEFSLFKMKTPFWKTINNYANPLIAQQNYSSKERIPVRFTPECAQSEFGILFNYYISKDDGFYNFYVDRINHSMLNSNSVRKMFDQHKSMWKWPFIYFNLN